MFFIKKNAFFLLCITLQLLLSHMGMAQQQSKWSRQHEKLLVLDKNFDTLI